MQVSKLFIAFLAVCLPACTTYVNTNDDNVMMLQSTDVINPSDLSPGTPAIARWTSMPFVTHNEEFRVEISAYHSSGIYGVLFAFNGTTTWVTEKTADEAGYYEYALNVKAGTLDPGQYEVTAVVVPYDGKQLRLEGRDYSYENVKNGYNSFRFNVGSGNGSAIGASTRTVTVGTGADYPTVSAAVAAEGRPLTHGGTILLTAEDHLLDMPRIDNDGYLLTIDGQGAASLSNPGGLQRGQRNSSYRFTDLTFNLDLTKTRFLNGTRDARCVIERCNVIGADPIDGFARDVQILGKSYAGDINYGLFIKDVNFRYVWKGMNGVTTAKRVSFDKTTGDAFGGSPGAVIDCTVVRAVKDERFHGQHCDLVQYSDAYSISNRIVADLFAPRHSSQIGHMSGVGFASDMAFVNWIIDCRTATNQSNGFNLIDTDNLLVENVTLIGGQFVWRDRYHTNITVRNTLMRNQTGLESDPPIFDEGADINIRFTRRMARDWGAGCTLGPVIIYDDYSWAPIEDINN